MQNQRGMILVLSYMGVSVLMMFGASLMVRSMTGHRAANQYVGSVSVFQAAEAGIDVAIAELRNNWAWDGSPYTSHGGIGGYQVAAATLSPTLKRVTSTGHVPNNVAATPGYQSRQVEVVVSLGDPTPFEDALFTEGNIAVDSNVSVDSYDSRVGPYGGANVTEAGNIGSNANGAGTISLLSNTEIHGDVAIGPGGNLGTDIVQDPTAVITGSGVLLSQRKDLGRASFPAGTAINPLILGGDDTQTLAPGTYRYTQVELDSNATVFVSGDVTLYVDQDFRLLSNSQFVTTCGSCTVIIYVGGTVDPSNPGAPPAVELDSNTVLSAGGDPTRLQLFVTGNGTTARSVVISSNVGAYGVIHAPYSTFTLDSNAVLYGAVIASRAEIRSNALIHFDVSLKDLEVAISSIRMESWREL